MAIYLSLIFLLIYARPGHAEIGASSDLNCDFGSLCRWRNVTGSADSGDFGISNRVEPGPGTFIMPMEEGDESGFAYTMGLMGRTVALLVSEVVNCQLGGASLQYWYYKTGPAASLEVCIRQPPGNLEPTGLRCYEGASPNYGRVWSFRAIELPPIGQPFELIFRSYYSPPTDIIALDNITYSAALCQSTNNGAEESAGGTFGDDSDLMMAMSSSSSSMTKSSMLTDFQGNEVSVPTDFAPPPPRDPFLAQSSSNLNRPVHLAAPTASGEELRSVTTVPHSSNIAGPRQGPLFKPRCSGIDCTFDDHRLCNYVTSEKNTSNLVDARSLHDWMITSQGVLNSLTGIPNDLSKNGGSFIYAGGKEISPLDTFILSSNEPVQITEPSRLDFFVYQAGIKGRFRVCIDSLVDCALVLKGSDIDTDSQRWKNYYVELRPGKHVVHFIADKLQDNYAIGLDHIQLLNRLGTAAQNC